MPKSANGAFDQVENPDFATIAKAVDVPATVICTRESPDMACRVFGEARRQVQRRELEWLNQCASVDGVGGAH